MLRTRILYVEDDAEIRSAMAQLLTLEGYDVAAVPSAEEALAALTSRRFDLLLTDYRLPAKNADWLLQEASAQRRLEGTPVIVLSAEAKPEGIDGYRFFRKPVDLDVLLVEMAQALGAASGAQSMMPTPAQPPPAAAAQLELVLYVTGTSLKSQKAMRNLQRALRAHRGTAVRLTVCDVVQEPLGQHCADLDADHILVTPTLVRRHPPPKVWLVGDLSGRELLDEVLAAPNIAELAKS